MSFDDVLTHCVTIVHPATVADARYGGTVKDWANATRQRNVAAFVTQTTTGEVRHDDSGSREAQVSQWIAYFKPCTRINAFDRVEWHGRTFEVDGDPATGTDGEGPHHTEVKLRTVAG